MPTLTYSINTISRTNALTGLNSTIKRIKPSIDGSEIIHHYAFDGSVTDVAAKAAVKADLEGPKGYGVLTEG